MIILDSILKSLVAVLAGAITANNPIFTVAYADTDGTAFTEASADGVLNGITEVELVAAPAASHRRIIRSLTIYNNDTVAATVSVSLKNGASVRVIRKKVLAAGDSLILGIEEFSALGVHDPVTLAVGSAAELTLSTQELSLAAVLTPTEHTAIGDASPHHAAVTLDVNAETLLSLSTQALGLDTQTANYVFAGPATGVPAIPAFRALVNADFPATLSPTFAGLTLTAFSGFVKATAGVLSAAALTDDDIPDTITLTNITQITNRSHTSLSDIGTLSHATIDTYLDQAVKQASSPTFAGLTVGSLAGVLKATAGVVAGSAVHADLGSIGANDHHNAITLDANADTLLSLSTQALGLDTQTANYLFVGPATGAAAVPTFRAMVAADLGTGLIPTFAGLIIPSISPAANFVLTQNSVAVMTSVGASAIVNTLYLKEGNVGIGTTSPGAKLDVNGIVNVLTQIKMGDGGWIDATSSGVAGALGFRGGTTYAGGSGGFVEMYPHASANGFRILTSNVAGTGDVLRLTISNAAATANVSFQNCKVGINDSAPGELLDVAGNINATGVLKIDDVQVISNQGAHVDDADAGTIVVQFNALLARLETHGLLASV